MAIVSDDLFKIDLHMHSNFSDGSYSPADLVAKAKKLNIQCLALTDHDTVSGINEFVLACEKNSIKAIKAIEISTAFGKFPLHILGYFIDESNRLLLDAIANLNSIRHTRNAKIIEKLQQQKIDIGYDEILEKNYKINKNVTIGRPHIAIALIQKGVVRDFEQAFNKYLGKGGLAYEQLKTIEFADVAIMLNKMDAKIFLAHPSTLQLANNDLDSLLKKLIDAGLQGIEVYNSAHNRNNIKYYKKLAEKYNLLYSGGSDFHGDKGRIGLGEANSGSYIYNNQVSEIFS